MPGPLGAAIGAVVGVAGRALATRGAQAAAATAGKELTEEAAKKVGSKVATGAQVGGQMLQAGQQASGQKELDREQRTRAIMDADIETGQFGKAVGDREMTMAPVDELMQQPTEVSSVFYHGGQKTLPTDQCTISDCPTSSQPVVKVEYRHKVHRSPEMNYDHHMCADCARRYDIPGSHIFQQPDVKLASYPMTFAWSELKKQAEIGHYPFEEMGEPTFALQRKFAQALDILTDKNMEHLHDLANKEREKVNAEEHFGWSNLPQTPENMDEITRGREAYYNLHERIYGPELATKILEGQEAMREIERRLNETREVDAPFEIPDSGLFHGHQIFSREGPLDSLIPTGVDGMRSYDIDTHQPSFDEMGFYPATHLDYHTMLPSEQMKYASEPMPVGDVLVKERKSPEAMRHKREYDKKYESSPERVKYREELNRERRRRGIYGSHDHMDVSHTEGGGLTLESQHANRGRHFKDKGTLRPIAKSLKDDLALLRNIMQGPMDEQDEKIVAALSRTIDEQSEEEMPEEEKHHESFGNANRFRRFQ